MISSLSSGSTACATSASVRNQVTELPKETGVALGIGILKSTVTIFRPAFHFINGYKVKDNRHVVMNQAT